MSKYKVDNTCLASLYESKKSKNLKIKIKFTDNCITKDYNHNAVKYS